MLSVIWLISAATIIWSLISLARLCASKRAIRVYSEAITMPDDLFIHDLRQALLTEAERVEIFSQVADKGRHKCGLIVWVDQKSYHKGFIVRIVDQETPVSGSSTSSPIHYVLDDFLSLFSENNPIPLLGPPRVFLQIRPSSAWTSSTQDESSRDRGGMCLCS